MDKILTVLTSNVVMKDNFLLDNIELINVANELNSNGNDTYHGKGWRLEVSYDSSIERYFLELAYKKNNSSCEIHHVKAKADYWEIINFQNELLEYLFFCCKEWKNKY